MEVERAAAAERAAAEWEAAGPNCDEMEAAVYESALSHLRKQLFLKTCVVCLTEPREMVFIHPNGIEHAG